MAPARRSNPDDPRAALYRALAAAYHASQALLQAEARYGRASAEAAAAHAQLRRAQADLMAREQAYLRNVPYRSPQQPHDQPTDTTSPAG